MFQLLKEKNKDKVGRSKQDIWKKTRDISTDCTKKHAFLFPEQIDNQRKVHLITAQRNNEQIPHKPTGTEKE